MGTRASFWVGDPRNLDEREWLGCIAFDGYPSAVPELSQMDTEEKFRVYVQKLSERDDFAFPDHGWPFPWSSDIFLTDFTYAFFNGEVQVACFHSPLYPFQDAIQDKCDWEAEDDSTRHVPAPSNYNPRQPDSIMVIGG